MWHFRELLYVYMYICVYIYYVYICIYIYICIYNVLLEKAFFNIFILFPGLPSQSSFVLADF